MPAGSAKSIHMYLATSRSLKYKTTNNYACKKREDERHRGLVFVRQRVFNAIGALSTVVSNQGRTLNRGLSQTFPRLLARPAHRQSPRYKPA
jgi:hypothetical protein